MTSIPNFSRRCPPIPRLARSFVVRPGSASFVGGVAGRGKSGGIRVIYFLRTKQGQIWMLTLYAKNVAESISANVLKQIKDEIDG